MGTLCFFEETLYFKKRNWYLRLTNQTEKLDFETLKKAGF